MRHLVPCLLLLLSLYATAEETPLVGNAYSPPKIYSEKGQTLGILADIVRYADEVLEDERFDLQLYPWARAYNMAEHARAGIIGLSMTEERLGIFDYSEPVFYDEVIVVVRRGQAFPFEHIEDLRGRRVGIGLGGSFGEAFERAKREGSLVVVEDNGPTMRLRKLLAGRIDAALINPGRAGLLRALQQDAELASRADEFEVLPVPLLRDPNYLAFHKSLHRGATLRAFNEVIRRGYENGDIQRIIERYTDR
ncbi:substrate-binding periplasmic protein [Pseudomonas indica]|uniref:ABC-type amino acid transport substrate-binding protein n=1 Tax=Pseudomonas indica TaxID=137658 RepID=A0A1G9IQ83_9PSED|nr:ABC transporter substrate-binding protein [Pseudomonas indica]MBU3059195.1 ABC transporter substrate-binding protein [Pseudomonas indica]SDL27322.1 ABC-type amino acid transport substrate-binding protein [Pseudomonas indica]